MTPVVALVGRVNVGKSTLFNRLTRSRRALVADWDGLTRDRQYAEAELGGRRFTLVDTGGLDGVEGIGQGVAKQARVAIEEADLVLLLVDARAGLTAGDVDIGHLLRTRGKPLLLLANKSDGLDTDLVLGDFHGLGLGEPIPIAASQGQGLSRLGEAIARALPIPDDAVEVVEGAGDAEGEAGPAGREDAIRLCVTGRPNVGKSTLVNCILGAERTLVSDQPGTTRDAIHESFERGGVRYLLTDTAGIRRRGNVREKVEKFSVVKALEAMRASKVTLLLIDAAEDLVVQDLHLLGAALKAGRATVLVLNKWDLADSEQRQAVSTTLERRLGFARHIRTVFVSALYGRGIDEIFAVVEDLCARAGRKISTSEINDILAEAVQANPPPMARGRRIKLRYAHLSGSNPPLVLVHGNQVAQVPDNYRHYLEARFRERLDLGGMPVRVEFRGGENPYAGRANELTGRQRNKRRRLMRFVKRGNKL